MECQHAIKSKILESFSVQWLLDCDTNDWGCSGGFPKNAFEFMKTNSEVITSSYPYTGVQKACFKAVAHSDCKVLDIQEPKENHESFKKALSQGVVAVGIQANQDKFLYYSSGII